MQVDEQPSAFRLLPSSHYSYGDIKIPSPQIAEQSPLAFRGKVYPPQVHEAAQVVQAPLDST